MLIQKYEPSFLNSIVDIYYRASLVSQSFLGEDFLRKECETIRTQYITVAETWVAADEGQVVGFVSMLGDEVGGLFVDPDRHRQGIGRALLDEARRGRPRLEVEVFENNARGRAFYQRYGFQHKRRYLHEESGQAVLRLELPLRMIGS